MSIMLSEHLPLLSSSLDGIQKLRTLILELAVRGKLVPQDPDDEPGDMVLQRIEQKRAHLEAQGKIRKPAPLPPVKEEERPFELPKGWAWTRLDSTGQYINGLPFKPSDWAKKGRPIIRIQNLSGRNDNFNYTERAVPSEYIVVQGDILVSWSATLDAYLWDREFEGVLNQHIFRVIPSEEISREYLYWLLRAVIREMAGSEKAHGLVMKHINRGPFLSHVVALPPLAEQHRIAAKISELMALCDRLEAEEADGAAAHARLVEVLLGTLTQLSESTSVGVNWQRLVQNFDILFSTESSIEALKQTIFQLAVTGKLVRQNPNDEPAAQVLMRIAEERGESGRADRLRKLKPLASASEVNMPFELPQGWAWARFPEIGNFGRGKSKHRPRNDPALFNPGYYPLIQTGEIARADNFVREYHSKYSEAGLLQSKMWPQGTLCITIAANIANSAILGFDACFPDSVVGFIPSPRIGDARYFLLFMKTARADLLRFAPSTAQKNINLEILESIKVPVPPLAEMKRIVDKVDELMALCDALKADLSESRLRKTRLATTLIEAALEAA